MRNLQENNKKEEQPQAGVIEVPIDLTLINNKLNYIIAKMDELLQDKKD